MLFASFEVNRNVLQNSPASLRICTERNRQSECRCVMSHLALQHCISVLCQRLSHHDIRWSRQRHLDGIVLRKSGVAFAQHSGSCNQFLVHVSEGEVERDGVWGQSGEVDDVQFVQSCQSAEGCAVCELSGCVVSDVLQGWISAENCVFVDSHQELSIVREWKSASSRWSEWIIRECGCGKWCHQSWGTGRALSGGIIGWTGAAGGVAKLSGDAGVSAFSVPIRTVSNALSINWMSVVRLNCGTVITSTESVAFFSVNGNVLEIFAAAFTKSTKVNS